MRVNRYAMVAAAVGLMACGVDHSLAPDVGRPLFVPGGTAAPAIIDDDIGVEYVAGAGLVFSLGLNRGLYEAATNGNEFSLTVSASISDGEEHTVETGFQSLLSLVKLAEPRPDPFVGIEVLAPWDGKFGGENPTTAVRVEFTISLMHLVNGEAHGLIEARKGSATIAF